MRILSSVPASLFPSSFWILYIILYVSISCFWPSNSYYTLRISFRLIRLFSRSDFSVPSLCNSTLDSTLCSWTKHYSLKTWSTFVVSSSIKLHFSKVLDFWFSNKIYSLSIYLEPLSVPFLSAIIASLYESSMPTICCHLRIDLRLATCRLTSL